MEVLFTLRIPEEKEVAYRAKYPTVDFRYAPITSEAIETAEVLVTYGNDVTSEAIERAKQLKWIMVAAAGIENFPKEKIAERGIIVTNAKGIHKTPMAESMLAHILALSKGLPTMYECEQTKTWNRRIPQIELRGQRALIVGPGAIGSETGRLLQAFGVETIGCNRSGRIAPHMDTMIQFDQLLPTLPTVDIVISILPSTDETYHLFTRAHFEAMKSSAIFLNFGRGDVLDERMLAEILNERIIRHAVLDVFEREPLCETSPLWTLPNCTVSPHISSLSNQYLPRSLDIFEQNLTHYVADQRPTLNVVDVVRGY